jgi:hypothetical protein
VKRKKVVTEFEGSNLALKKFISTQLRPASQHSALSSTF